MHPHHHYGEALYIKSGHSMFYHFSTINIGDIKNIFGTQLNDITNY